MRPVICFICILVSQFALSKNVAKASNWHVSCQNESTTLTYFNNFLGTGPALSLNDTTLCNGNEVKISYAIESSYMMIQCDLSDASIFVAMPQLRNNIRKFEASLDINDENFTLQCKATKMKS